MTTERASQLERIVEMVPAPSGNTGVGSAMVRMILKGPRGATQFALSAGWFLDETLTPWIVVRRRNFKWWDRTGRAERKDRFQPSAWDVGYHAKAPQYEGQTVITDCPYTGGPCYYDSGGLRAEDWFKELLKGGSDRIWALLEADYRHRFEGGPEPEI